MAGKMVKSLGGNSNSQSVRDRLNAAKHSISGSGLAKSICKATTDQVISPKPKHLTYLTMCTNEPNVSIPEMADKLLQRTQDTSWVVVFKSLITVHNLMNQGNERFTQYVASNNRTVNLQNFSDKSGVQGYDMSLFIRRYARYINQKAVSYRTMAFDFCRVKRGKSDGVLRTMGTEKLLKALPVIQEQVDALVEFDATPNELCNNVINAAFILLFNDLIRLFACYNDGVINLLEQYFDMNKKQCREALDIYKKFVLRMEKVSSFLRVAERFGIDKGDIPDLAKAPSSLLEALEQHLASLEGRKITTGAGSGAAAGGTGARTDKSGTGTAGTTVNGAGVSGYSLSQAERQKIIEEEKLRLAAFKEQRQLSLERMAVTVNQSPASPMATVREEPALSSAASSTVAPPPSTTTAATAGAAAARPSDDLFGMFEGHPNPAPAAVPSSEAAWAAPGGMAPQAAFAGREVNFEAAFGTQPQTASSEFGNILQPQSSTSAAPNQPITAASDMPMGGPSVITTDIDTSLASLAGNLNISDSGNMKKQDHKWINPPATMQQRTGGTAFSGPTISTGPTISWAPPTVGAPPPMAVPPMAPAWQGTAPMYGAAVVPPGGAVFAPVYAPQQAPAMSTMGAPGMYAPAAAQPAAFFPMQPPQPAAQRPPGAPADPFGL